MLFLDAALDLVFGSTCLGCGRPGRLLCGSCRADLAEDPFSAMPSPPPEGLVPVTAAAPYAGTVRRMVPAHKERAAPGLAGPLGALLATAVAAVVADLSPEVRPVLVPVPSHPTVV